MRERQLHFIACLTYAGKNDFVRIAASRDDALQFAT